MTRDDFDALLKNPTQKIALAASLQSSLVRFIKIRHLYEGFNITITPTHIEICNKLEDIVKGKNIKKNIALCLPPGFGKSFIVDNFIGWCFCRDINYTFLYVSHSEPLITKRSGAIKNLFLNNKNGTSFLSELYNIALNKDERAKINWSLENSYDRSGLRAMSIGSGITGMDAGNSILEGFSGALIMDDVMNASDSRSAIEKDNVVNQYIGTLKSRRRSTIVPMILIMQRLHRDDLVGFLKEHESDEWDFVEVPVLNDKDESIWETKFPATEYIKMRDSSNIITRETFWTQYMQQPRVFGGSLINTQWFQYYESYGNMQFSRLFMTGDTAMKEKEHNDFSVFCLWGIANNGLYLLDMIRGKWDGPDLKEQVINFWNKWKAGINQKRCTSVHIEDKASGTWLIQDLVKTTAIPIYPIKRTASNKLTHSSSKDNVERVGNILDYIKAGRVFLPRDNQALLTPFLAECEEFTRDGTHRHDDIVDCLIDGIIIGFTIGSVSIFDTMPRYRYQPLN